MDGPGLRPPPPLAKRIAALVVLLVLAGLGVAVGGRVSEALQVRADLEVEREAAAQAAGEIAEVNVIRVAAAQTAPVVLLTGTLEPTQAADLAFGVPGRVSSVEVQLGQAVERGDVLVRLDRASLGAQSAQSTAGIRVAEANAEMARDRVQTLDRLVRAGSMPERQLVTARQQLAITEAQLSQARAGRRQIAATSADHVLRAPFDGIVTRVPSGVGVAANPGVPLVRVEDLSSLRLRTTVNQHELEGLTVGDSVDLDGSGAVGSLTAVVRSLDAQTRRAPVEVRVPNAERSLVANSYVRARITVGERRPVWRIPATARRIDGSVLRVTADSRLEARDVSAELDEDGSWLVNDGLEAGDRVVVRAVLAREGTLIRPIEPEGASSAPTAEFER